MKQYRITDLNSKLKTTNKDLVSFLKSRSVADYSMLDRNQVNMYEKCGNFERLIFPLQYAKLL